jgi:hypothetical protein
MSIVHARFAIIGEEEPGFDSYRQVKFNGKIVEKINIQLWEDIPEQPGYVRAAGRLTIDEVCKQLNEKLKALDIAPDEYGFDLWNDWDNKNDEGKEFPVWRWIACYPVTGTSEGHYMHIDVITPTGEHKHMYLAKTLREGQPGMEYAYEVCKVAALLLQACGGGNPFFFCQKTLGEGLFHLF